MNIMTSNSPRHQGRRILVTGAGSGIGRAVALRLHAEGAHVAATDARGDSVVEIAAMMGDSGIGLACDVGDEESVTAAVAAAAEPWGGLDGIVTCAGIVRAVPTHDCSLEEWETMLRVNLTGTFLPIKHCLPHLMAASGGSIVTIGSVASVVAAGRASSYDASKGGVLQFTRALAVEYVEHGIRANCVLPGLVATGLAANSVQLHGPMDTTGTSSPAGRLQVPMSRAAEPDEIATVVSFLLSSEASFVTGASVAADGGYTAI